MFYDYHAGLGYAMTYSFADAARLAKCIAGALAVSVEVARMTTEEDESKGFVVWHVDIPEGGHEVLMRTEPWCSYLADYLGSAAYQLSIEVAAYDSGYSSDDVGQTCAPFASWEDHGLDSSVRRWSDYGDESDYYGDVLAPTPQTRI